MSSTIGQRALHNARNKKKQKASTDQLLERARALQQSGVLGEAKAVYRQLLQLQPNHFNALYLLGQLEYQARSYQEAEGLLRAAIAANPRSADAHMHLGIVLNALQRFEEAHAAYLKSLALAPGSPITLNNLGNVCVSLQRHQEAINAYDQALALRSDVADIHYNRALALLKSERYAEAIAGFDRALALDPRYIAALNDRGNALHWLECYREAVASFDRAIAIDPGFVEAYNGRAASLIQLHHYDAAFASLARALAIKPDYANALTNRGTTWVSISRFAEALADFERAIALAPASGSAWAGRADALLELNRVAEAIESCEKSLSLTEDSTRAHAVVILGQCFAKLGRVADALASFDIALAIKPGFEHAITNKIFSLDFDDNATFESHRDARRVWWDSIGARLAPAEPIRHQNPRDPNRRLVLGYVSPDFRSHSAALAFKPVLQRHDKTQFELICYSCGTRRDATTEQFRAMSDRWHDASQWSDDQLAARIRDDKIDILIDLAGHTGGNRLGVFARKPAPIQVHGWGAVTPPGLETLDYVFADPVSIPRAVRHLFCETIYDLPCILTIEPLPAGVTHAETPALANGYVTFGVFNRISKITDVAAAVWSRILERVPNARLLIKHGALDDPLVGQNLRARFAQFGAPDERIDLMGSTDRLQHLAALNRVDICFDPFPHNGGASTWEALQMGAPVIAKLGKMQVGRAGGAIVTAAGLPDWVTDTDEGYIDIAVDRAARVAELAALRRALPAQLAASAAGNPDRYEQAVANAYRTMWRTYCERGEG
jgi:predicted O-linked N-acetylglucosamine transferase (SPINDLY family)/TolA-binding protein